MKSPPPINGCAAKPIKIWINSKQMLQGISANGCQNEITDYQQTGDTIIAQVEVSDRGLAWGTQTILAVVRDGEVHAFDVTGFRLMP